MFLHCIIFSFFLSFKIVPSSTYCVLFNFYRLCCDKATTTKQTQLLTQQGFIFRFCYVLATVTCGSASCVFLMKDQPLSWPAILAAERKAKVRHWIQVLWCLNLFLRQIVDHLDHFHWLNQVIFLTLTSVKDLEEFYFSHMSTAVTYRWMEIYKPFNGGQRIVGSDSNYIIANVIINLIGNEDLENRKVTISKKFSWKGRREKECKGRWGECGIDVLMGVVLCV